jgi:hypothetical protein
VALFQFRVLANYSGGPATDSHRFPYFPLPFADGEPVETEIGLLISYENANTEEPNFSAPPDREMLSQTRFFM